MGIEGFRERLSWALDGNSVEAIESHREALLSEVERIEGAAAREAQMRGWDLNEIKDLMRRMLAETQCTLRAADSAFCGLEAAHHAACIEDLAGELSRSRMGHGIGLRKGAQISGRSSTWGCRRSGR